MTRNLGDLVKKEYFVLDSEYLTTQLVVVPKYVLKYSPFLFIKKKNNTVVIRNLFIFISQTTAFLTWPDFLVLEKVLT